MPQGSLFSTPLSTLFISCLFDNAILTGVRRYLIVVLTYIFLMVSDLSTFGCACWLFVCLLWKKACSDPLPIFKLDYSYFAVELYEFFLHFEY